MNNLYYLLALVAGLLLPMQIAFNNKLTNYSSNPVTSSLISFSVGTMALLLYSVTQFSSFQKSLQQVGQAPGYAWLGGLVGAFYIISTIVASPKIGLALFLALIIGGQLVTSVIVDHFGLLGAAVKPITLLKGIGLLLVFTGIILLKK
jgi:bacterial/archaeal transporter family-2 protein